MKIKKIWIQFYTVLIFLFLVNCSSNTLDPQFEPEIINNPDAFQFQATDLSKVSESLTYSWQNSGPMANINQSCSIGSGSAVLTINDADGTEVYRKDLSDNGTFVTVSGKAGNWHILVNLSGVNGTLNFRAEKRTP